LLDGPVQGAVFGGISRLSAPKWPLWDTMPSRTRKFSIDSFSGLKIAG